LVIVFEGLVVVAGDADERVDGAADAYDEADIFEDGGGVEEGVELVREHVEPEPEIRAQLEAE
jgi:hypothetical protein